MSRRAPRRQPDEGAPTLLLAFFAATVAMVAAVVAIGSTGSDWADVGAIALLLGVVALIGVMIARLLSDRDR